METPSYTHVEMAALLGIKPQTLTKMNKSGTGPPYVRLSERCKVYPSDAYRAWLRKKQQSLEPLGRVRSQAPPSRIKRPRGAA